MLLDGDISEASAVRDKISPLFGVVTVKAKSTRALPNGTQVVVEDRFRNPLAVKTIMNGLGMPSGSGRHPLGKMNVEGIQIVRKALDTVWSNNPEILEPIAKFYGIDVEARLASDRIWDELRYIQE